MFIREKGGKKYVEVPLLSHTLMRYEQGVCVCEPIRVSLRDIGGIQRAYSILLYVYAAIFALQATHAYLTRAKRRRE